MGRTAWKIKRPEGGAERELVVHEHHRCKQSNALWRDLGEDVDLLQFPVGLAGWEMPLGIPFDVTSVQPCQACGNDVVITVIWDGPSIIMPRSSSLWTPPNG